MAPSNEELARQWFEQVWNQGRDDLIAERLSEGMIAHGLTDAQGNPIRGPEGFRAFWREFRSALPDVRINVEDAYVAGEVVVARCHVTGTHLGAGLGLQPSGRPVQFEGIAIIRVRNGKFVEAWNQFDFLSFYRQIGMEPAPVPAALA